MAALRTVGFASEFTVDFDIAAGAPWYDAHFPGRPVVPGVVLFITGICYYLFTQDAPDGNFDELRERGELPPANGENGAGQSFLAAAKDIRVEDVSAPSQKLGANDVLIKPLVTGICGTDLHIESWDHWAEQHIVPPLVIGHEFVGEVAAVGSNVKNFKVGQRVMAANSAPCGECYYCRRDQENLCSDLLFNNGAYAEYIRIPDRIVRKNLHVLPDHVGYQDAALAEPLACALRGLEQSNLRAGDTILFSPSNRSARVRAVAICGLH